LPIFTFAKKQKMIRVNDETPTEVLQDIKIGDLITDGFSKTSLVENIETKDDGLYKIYEFYLNTGRVITTKR
jgi:NAD-specific glutamate dehydrogenase